MLHDSIKSHINNIFRSTQIKVLDEALKKTSIPQLPRKGWIHSIRTALCMSRAQLAKRLGISRQSLAVLEANEVHQSITLKSLHKVAEAMECKLVYAIVPKEEGGLKNIIAKRANALARQVVDPVSHTMALEDQAVEGKETRINELAEDLMRNLSNKIWE